MQYRSNLNISISGYIKIDAYFSKILCYTKNIVTIVNCHLTNYTVVGGEILPLILHPTLL